MSEFYIYHHLGLGDHFICNGLVRELIKDQAREQFLFVKHHNLETVSQMYEDTDLQLIGVSGDGDVLDNYWNRGLKGFQIGFGHLTQYDAFDKQFYRLAGVPFEKRWSSFKVNRCEKKEQSLIYQLNLPAKFALLHEDESRGYVVDRNKINLPIVKLRPIRGFTIIDWLGVADLAEEIHVIDSSFLSLIDQSNLKFNLFFHKYSRNATEWETPTTKKHWTIYD